MRHAHRYISSLFLAAALAAPVAIMAAPGPQDASVQIRVYDRSHKDYHNWDDREATLGEYSYPRITEILTNSRRPTRESSQITGIGAMLIQTGTSEGITSATERRMTKIRPRPERPGRGPAIGPLRSFGLSLRYKLDKTRAGFIA